MQTAPQTVGIAASKEQDHDDNTPLLGKERKNQQYGNASILMTGRVNRERGPNSPYCNNIESK